MYTLNLKIEFTQDSNDDLLIANLDGEINKSTVLKVSEHRILGEAEIRYGIITLGAKSKLLAHLIPSSTVNVEFAEKRYVATVHKTTKGRLDGLTSLIRHNSKTFCWKFYWVHI